MYCQFGACMNQATTKIQANDYRTNFEAGELLVCDSCATKNPAFVEELQRWTDKQLAKRPDEPLKE